MSDNNGAQVSAEVWIETFEEYMEETVHLGEDHSFGGGFTVTRRLVEGKLDRTELFIECVGAGASKEKIYLQQGRNLMLMLQAYYNEEEVADERGNQGEEICH